MMYNLYIFTRDLRIIDNNGLYFCNSHYSHIIPMFIFTPEQIGIQNSYKSNNSIQFMYESLHDLNKELNLKDSKLHIFYSDYIKCLQSILDKIKIINSITITQDYTPYAIERQQKIKDFCTINKIIYNQIEDYLLKPIGTILKSDKHPYTIFTPFKNEGLKYNIAKPKKEKLNNLIMISDLGQEFQDYIINSNLLVKGGRSRALKRLKKIHNYNNYNLDRNMVSKPTTLLSAYIKFGCLSIREVYWSIKKVITNDNDSLISQLFWREFYFYIAYYFPRVLHGKNYNSKFDNIKWTNNKDFFHSWCQGKTGYPIVDAGMIELNITGYMHNRSRLFTSNFLNRLLNIDWRWGEKYFANQLTDYDPSVNNGNWQWIASTGVDPKPFNQRLFNPWLQSKKYDPNASYIKKWLPQLNAIPAHELHEWDKYYQNYNLEKIKYYKPIVNYSEARQNSLNSYKNI